MSAPNRPTSHSGSLPGASSPSLKGSGRKFEISALSVFLCLVVVFIHVSAYAVSALEPGTCQHGAVFVPWRLSAFVVQGFIFLGGLRFALSRRKPVSYGVYLRGRFLSVVVPYLIWAFLYYLYFVRHDYFAFDLGHFARSVLVGDLVGPFYFIIAIVQFYLLAPLWTRLLNSRRPAILLAVSLAVTLLSLRFLPALGNLLEPGYSFPYGDRIFTTYLFYWIGGCLAGKYYRPFAVWVRGNRWLIAAAFLVSAAVNLHFSFAWFVRQRAVAGLENLHFLYCVCAILFFFSLALAIGNRPPAPWARRGILALDRVGYAVFLSHSLVIFIVNDWLFQKGIRDVGTALFLRALLTYGIALGGCLLWGHLRSALRRKPGEPSRSPGDAGKS